MVFKALKHTLQIVSAVLAGIALLVLVFAWKLSQGPISLPQLTPYVVEAVSTNTRGMSVKIKDTILSWEGWDRTLDIRILGTTVFTRDGRRLASIPEAALSLSGPAMVKGIVAPKSIELIRPEIHLLRKSDGAFAFEMGDGMSVRADRAFNLEQLIGRREDPNRPLSYIKEIAVDNAEFHYEDKATGATFVAPNTTLSLQRIGETIIFDTGLDVLLNGKSTKLDLNASYNLTTEILDAEAVSHALFVADIANLIPELDDLKALEFSLAGKVNLAMDKAGKVRSFFADLSASEGFLSVPEPALQKLELDALSIRLGYEDFNDRIRIEEFLLALKQGKTLRIPEPLAHDMPMESIRLTGDYEVSTDTLNLEQLSFDMGEGPTGSVTGEIEGIAKGPKRTINIVGELLKVNPSNLHRYWPEGLSVDAREWVVNQLSDGLVHRASINLSAESNEKGEINLNHVFGDMELDGITVDYLPPMPVVKNAKGWAKYDHQSFKITITSGEVDKIKVERAQVDITGLDEYDQRLTVNLVADGPLRDSLEFIDNKPLGFAKALGIEPKKTSGKVKTELDLTFLLLKDISWDGVEVTAKAKGKNISIDDVIFDEDLHKGEIDLVVDKKGMDVEGKIVLGSIPADLKWRENFDRNTMFKRRFLLDGMVNDQQRIKELRLDFPPFNNNIMTGPIHVDATITEKWDGIGLLETFADLQGAKIDIPVINWVKGPEGIGQAYAKVQFNRERVISVPYFSIAAKDLKASGSIGLDQTGSQLQIMRISRFEAGRTRITGGTVLFSPKIGWEVDVHGKSLDLADLLSEIRSKDRSQDEPSNEDTDTLGTFSGRFDKIWLDADHSLQTVAGAVSSDGKIWKEAHLTGVVDGGEAFLIDLSPEGTNRRLKMETKDAGALLRALDLFDDMQGGDLSIEGVLNDDIPRRPLVGSIRVTDYRITEVPALAKILSLVALTGVLDALEGDGIGFTSLVSPFKYDNGVIEFKDGRTNGISIGLTWEGNIYTHANVADMQGTVVPAYGLNALLGNVPILGQLFSAGEKGGGLFAWTYNVTGNLDDPDVGVNPVSALAPGIFRRIFQLKPEEKETPK